LPIRRAFFYPRGITMKLRTFLLAVMSLTLVPLLGVAGLAIWWAHQDERRNMEQVLLYHARSLSVAVDRELETTRAGLTGLSTSDDLDAQDLGKFYEQARLAHDAYRRWMSVALADASGRQALNLMHPLGAALPSLSGLEAFQRTIQAREPQVSNLIVDPTTARRVIAVTLPLLRDGEVRHVLIAFLTPESFASVLAAAQITGGNFATIVDRRGVVVATTRDPGQWVGQPSPVLAARVREHEEEVFAGPSREGSAAYTAFSRGLQSRFAVSITAPREQLEAPLRRSLWLLTGAAIAGFSLSLGVANLAGRRFTGRLRRLAGAFAAFGRGEPIPELPKFTLSELRGVGGALHDAMALLQTRATALQESEQRYRTTFERTPAGMCLALEDGSIVDCNEAFARILGFERPADVLTTNIAQLYVEPKQREELLERVKASGTAVNGEIQMRRRDGRLIWVLASVVRSSGPPRGDFETALVDITEQKAADELRTIARLANGAAHEINNPLALVVGRLEMLLDDASLAPDLRERIVHIHAAAERIREIVIDMTHLTRVQLYEHTGSGLPEMIDIRKSAAGPGGPDKAPSA
jgi:PAS domain S-box-containing protein